MALVVAEKKRAGGREVRRCARVIAAGWEGVESDSSSLGRRGEEQCLAGIAVGHNRSVDTSSI